MSHSLIGADRATHCRIVVVAAASAISLLAFAVSAWRPAADTSVALAPTQPAVVKAAKPVVSAKVEAGVIR
jgi:hypothetical protein